MDGNLKAKERKLSELAKYSWGLAIKDFYYPPLNEPNFIFDYTRKEGFYIDPSNKWQITMNLANTPLLKEDSEYIQYYRAILLHEISHYQIIPYDGVINARLLRAAMKHVKANFAPLVVNLFSDLIIDTKLYQNNPALMTWELKKTFENISYHYGESLSEFSKFLFNTYEKLWDVKIDTSFSSSNTDNLAKRVKNIVMDEFENDSLWEEKVTRISYHLRKFLSDEFTITVGGYRSAKGKSKRKVPGNNLEMQIPDDVLEIMDNPLESKNRDRLNQDNEDELRRKAEEFARNVPFSEFGAPAGQAGILIDASPLATWYRGRAKNLIEIKVYEEKSSGELPVYPEKWKIGNPIEDLDIILTLLNFPIIIPNITTKKWKYMQGSGYLLEKQIPDLLLVLDSSGSMQWNIDGKTEAERGPYHIALIASFAILHYAFSKGVKASVINFSNFADISDWTTNFHEAEKTLLRYQGGGTEIPIKAIIKQVNKAERKILLFIITDFGIHNWVRTKSLLMQLADNGHKVVGFFIGSDKIPKDKFKSILDKVSFYGIKSAKDLINLVILEVKKHYT